MKTPRILFALIGTTFLGAGGGEGFEGGCGYTPISEQTHTEVVSEDLGTSEGRTEIEDSSTDGDNEVNRKRRRGRKREEPKKENGLR